MNTSRSPAAWTCLHCGSHHKQERQYTYKVTLRQVCLGSAVLEMQQCVLHIVELHYHSQQFQYPPCFTTMLWCQIYVAGDNETYFGRNVKCPIRTSYCPIVTKIRIWQFFIHTQNQISWKTIQWEPWWYMRTDGLEEANRHFSRLWERA